MKIVEVKLSGQLQVNNSLLSKNEELVNKKNELQIIIEENQESMEKLIYHSQNTEKLLSESAERSNLLVIENEKLAQGNRKLQQELDNLRTEMLDLSTSHHSNANDPLLSKEDMSRDEISPSNNNNKTIHSSDKIKPPASVGDVTESNTSDQGSNEPIASLKAEIQSLKDTIAANEVSKDEFCKIVLIQSEFQKQDLQKKFDLLMQSKLEEWNQQKTEYEEQIKSLKDNSDLEMNTLKSKYEEQLNNLNTNLNSDQQIGHSQIIELQERIESLQNELDTITLKYQSLENELKACYNSISVKEHEMNKLLEQIVIVNEEKEGLLLNNNLLTNESEEYKAKNLEFESLNAQYLKKIHQLEVRR